MHMRNGTLGIGFNVVEDIRRATIGIELSVHWHVHIAN